MTQASNRTFVRSRQTPLLQEGRRDHHPRSFARHAFRREGCTRTRCSSRSRTRRTEEEGREEGEEEGELASAKGPSAAKTSAFSLSLDGRVPAASLREKSS